MMEEMLKQILDGQKILTKEIQMLKSGQDQLKSDFSALKSDVSELKSDVSALKSDVSELKSDVSALKSDVSELKSGQGNLEEGQAKLWQEVVSIRQEMGTKAQQDENTAIIKALLHSQEETNAKLESLALTTATREHAERLEAKFDHLNVRLFNQEAELTLLKAVK